MEEYLSELKKLFDQLDSIGFPMTDLEKIHGLLSGLGKEYESVSTVVEHSMDSVPGHYYEDVVFKVTAFNENLKTYSSASVVTPHLAFQAEKSRGNYSTRGRGFQQHGRGSQGQDNHNKTSGSARPTCQICGKYGHSVYDCYNSFNEDYVQQQTTALAAMRISDGDCHSNGTEWLLDSGSTSHITNSTANLQHSQSYRGNNMVMVENGDFLIQDSVVSLIPG
ncbi:PREDICTED: uncharacterized protein LOC104759657 [Camelina sativa]|uniref:Uncharacterized protein LOC104759657 n=1 Tax=Camelina sativa TaxID=90675 RepID=A0ABM0X564_CAMSA|nr:PREDICTED: uncharacterized protein LOC104759657 [Camelina sativa]